jgi:preprotein translocase subunit SecY
MLSAFRNALKIPELRGKILFTLAIIAVYRLGSHLPVPGVDVKHVQQFLNSSQAKSNGAFTLINLFSGGALTSFAVFALGIMPYITSSIIMQLLGVVIPRLEQLRKEGEIGQKKIQQYTRYVTVALALLQSAGIISLAQSGNLLQGVQVFGSNLTPYRFALALLTLTAGTALIMWLGELITQRGVGNGMSILIFTAVVARLPSETANILRAHSWVAFVATLLIGVVIIVGVIWIEQAQRRIPVQYAKRMVGRRMYGGQSTYIPIKVNTAGVIPIIFASSLLSLPTILASIVHTGWIVHLADRFARTGTHPLYIISYFLLIIAFAYFYNSIAFNVIDQADNMKKYGGFIPGIRPGRPTAEYLDYIMTRITLPGALFVALIAILPFLFLAGAQIQQFPFGGTAILITVGVGLETMKQIESQLLTRNYEGFLR